MHLFPKKIKVNECKQGWMLHYGLLFVRLLRHLNVGDYTTGNARVM